MRTKSERCKMAYVFERPKRNAQDIVCDEKKTPLTCLTSSYACALRTRFWERPCPYEDGMKTRPFCCVFTRVSVTVRTRLDLGEKAKGGKIFEERKSWHFKPSYFGRSLCYDVNAVSWRYLDGRRERQIVPSSVPLYVFSPPHTELFILITPGRHH